MIPNTALFADFIKAARNAANLTQDNLNERGAPYRQLQGKVENGELPVLETALLMQYDRAYGWPKGYAAAAAQAAAYASGDLTGDGLPDDDRPHLAALYEPGRYNAPAALGFDPATGRPVYAMRPILTNIPFETLRAIVDSRAGTILFDVNAADEHLIHQVGRGDIAVERKRTLYRTAPGEGSLNEIGHLAKPIAIDPLTGLTNMVEARLLARALLAIYPSSATTAERAAFTFLAIAAFGKDPFITIGALLTGGRLLPEFTAFWETFRDQDSVDADLAQPDLHACRLLVGLGAARTSALGLEIGPYYEGHQRTARYAPPVTTRSERLSLGEQDRVVFYDSLTAPETPVCLNWVAIGAAMTVYRAPVSPQRDRFPAKMAPARLPDPLLMLRSIGITPDLDDLTLVAHHQNDRLDTLTNLFGRYAVFCESGMATVVWIPAV